jgi:hypothetical protein
MTFEERAAGLKPEEINAFRVACQTVFDSPQGRMVLSRLVGAAHPMMQVEGMTAHQHGQCEVVACIWRFAALSTTDIQPPKP